MSLGHAQGTTGQLWPRCRAKGQQESQQQAELGALCSVRYREQEMLLQACPQALVCAELYLSMGCLLPKPLRNLPEKCPGGETAKILTQHMVLL